MPISGPIPSFPLNLRYNQFKPSYRLEGVDAIQTLEIQTKRIFCRFCIAGSRKKYEFLIDTGAPLSVIPKMIWTKWPAGSIERFNLLDENEELQTVKHGVAGKSARVSLGRIKISLRYEPEQQNSKIIETEPFEFIAKFVQEESTFNRAVLGFGGNAMERWQGLDIDFRKPGNWTARLV